MAGHSCILIIVLNGMGETVVAIYINTSPESQRLQVSRFSGRSPRFTLHLRFPPTLTAFGKLSPAFMGFV